ncbi:hypothetical protein [Thioalkalivibrio sp.]|uniref:hypothetical protein n=1 Tax=Thioalkalivibrio sp. TaxID=2093813 RepID=UPI00397494D7
MARPDMPGHPWPILGPISADWLATLAIAGILLLSSILVHPSAIALLPGFLVLALLVAMGECPVRRGLALAWRLKWFFLSLLLFFGWMDPGAGPWGWDRLRPSPEGLGDAGVRIGALVLVVCWVAWLTAAFERTAQIRGLARWLSLLRPLGLRAEVVAERLFLALDYFEAQRRDYLEFRLRVQGTRFGLLRAGREFLITRLDAALAGASPRIRQSDAPERERLRPLPTGARLVGQVLLLWLAVLLIAGLRLAG